MSTGWGPAGHKRGQAPSRGRFSAGRVERGDGASPRGAEGSARSFVARASRP